MIDAHQIAKNLWQGSIPAPGKGLKRAGFSLVVFCAQEYQPLAWLYSGVDVLYMPLHDDYKHFPHRDDVRAAMQTAADVADAVDGGEKVLVTCVAGRNRSGLVTALALCDLFGVSGQEALEIVQSRRRHATGGALENPQFQKLLRRVPAQSRATSEQQARL